MDMSVISDGEGRGVCLLPDLFDFLSDGFGQRESLCLDPLDGHCPAITVGEIYF